MINEYGFVRVGAVVPKMKVADIKYNIENILNQIKEAEEKNIQILVFPELAITGYTCADLFNQDILITKSEEAIVEILEETKKYNIITIIGVPIQTNNLLFNCAIVIQKGKILGIVPKSNISNNEERYFNIWQNRNFIELKYANNLVPFGTNIIFRNNNFKEISFAIEIGEDLWVIEPPSNKHAINGANIIFNLSASNELIGKSEYRKDLVKIQSAKTISGYIYTSSGINESTTDTVMSGHAIIAENGNILVENEKFNFESTIISTEIDVKRLIADRRKSISYINKNINEIEYRYVDIDIVNNVEKLQRKYDENPFLPRNS